MRIVYSSIQFELTRRCNQSCDHCCRGKSQSVDLSKEVVDAFFDKNDIYSINDLKFSGGEPTLNGSMLEYIVDKIIEKNIPVYHFALSINGLSYSEELVNGLNKLNEYCKQFDTSDLKFERYGFLFISQSQYHRKACDEVIEKLKELPYFLPPNGVNYIESDNLLPYGNAYKNNLTSNIPNIEEVTDYDSTVKIVEYEGEEFIVFKHQYISSNGYVLTDGCISYDMMDKYHIGNVLEKSMIEMFDKKAKIKNKKQ